MKKLLAFFAIALLFVATFSSCARIDAGYEGIKVKQYGSDKGVQDTALVTGRVWYNPVNYDVVQYPIFFRTADYEAFSVNAKDGSIFDIDPMINSMTHSNSTPTTTITSSGALINSPIVVNNTSSNKITIGIKANRT